MCRILVDLALGGGCACLACIESIVGQPALGNYLTSPDAAEFFSQCRCRAGQAVVQMAKGRHDGVEYAIKFYVSRSAFKAEMGLYSQRTSKHASGLGQFLPQVFQYLSWVGRVAHIFLYLLHGGMFTDRSISVDQRNTVQQVRNVESNADKRIKDPQGNPLPPCIVMERGESLDIWSKRAKPDRSPAFTVRLSVLSLRLAHCFNLLSTICVFADGAPRRHAHEGLPCTGLRAPRPQARQRDVAAPREPLDRHRLWLCSTDRGAGKAGLQHRLRGA